MCGIVGFYSSREFASLKEGLPFAAAALQHRGPDDSGIFFDYENGVGLAQRRLSIIDLSDAGKQPMATEDGAVQIVYNGEVYNFKSIRDQLKCRGHRFSSTTDTEVILKSYVEWGIDCLERFVGMFALAIWDRNRKTLYLARDRMGIKPLYYHNLQGTLVFASELKGLFAFKDFPREIDADAVSLFLHYQYVPAPGTILGHTFKLLPGTYLVCDSNGIRTVPFWHLPTPHDRPGDVSADENEAIEQLDHLLTRAVSDRLVSDVPLGALLSGGIDSSMVVALMQSVNPTPVRTFSIGFTEAEYNEAPWASKIADFLGTHHTEMVVSEDDALAVVPRLADIYDEPFADSSAIPTFLVSQLARTQLTVALSGDGGDEQFAGYVRYWMTNTVDRHVRRIPHRTRAALTACLGRLPAAWIASCYAPIRTHLPQRFQVANFEEKWLKLLRQIDRTDLASLYRATICQFTEDEIQQITGNQLPQSGYERLFLETDGWTTLSRLMHVDQKTYLPDAMLTKVDRASMAVGLEVRVPLLDHRVVAWTAAMPDHFKYRNGRGKYLLRKLLARYLPTELIERPKMGFGVPVGQWLRGKLKPLFMDYLSEDRLRREGRFNTAIVGRLISEHMSGTVDHKYRLWPLLMWEMWRERWLAG